MGSMTSSTSVEIEILIGVLTAVTLILLFFFLVILAYSKRQKFLGSPTTRALNPFPAVQINMKELLTANSPVLSGETSQANPAIATLDFEQQPAMFEDCRSKWHSTGHMDFAPNCRSTALRSSIQSTTNITSNPMCSEYASVDIQNIGSHYKSLKPIAAPKPPTIPPANGQQQSSYNLGHYFPRVSSEPPSRKSYQTTTGRGGDALKVRKFRKIRTTRNGHFEPFYSVNWHFWKRFGHFLETFGSFSLISSGHPEENELGSPFFHHHPMFFCCQGIVSFCGVSKEDIEVEGGKVGIIHSKLIDTQHHLCITSVVWLFVSLWQQI